MRHALVLLLLGALGVTGLTACMSDSDESASATTPRRSAALIASGPGTGSWQLTIDGLTPTGKAIEADSFSWGITSPVSFTSTGTTTGKAQVQDLKIVKTIDEMSPLLFQAVATGKHYLRATLSLRKGSETAAVEYASYLLEDVLVTGSEQGGSNPNVPVETVTLAARKVTQKFTPVSDTGKVGIATQFGWDSATATKY